MVLEEDVVIMLATCRSVVGNVWLRVDHTHGPTSVDAALVHLEGIGSCGAAAPVYMLAAWRLVAGSQVASCLMFENDFAIFLIFNFFRP